VAPRKAGQLPVWTAGDAWLLEEPGVSEPQAHLTRLIDLTDFQMAGADVSERA